MDLSLTWKGFSFRMQTAEVRMNNSFEGVLVRVFVCVCVCVKLLS
jgi:hypothetical protein